MNVAERIGQLAARVFTDRRLFGLQATYWRTGKFEIKNISVAPYNSDPKHFVFGEVVETREREFLVPSLSLAINEVTFTPERDDYIIVSGISYKVTGGKKLRPFRYLDAAETMLIVTTIRQGKHVDSE